MSKKNGPGSIGRRGVFAGAAGLALGSLAAPHVARAAVRVARVGHNNADDTHFARGALAFAAAVAAEPSLASDLRIEVYGNSKLGDDMAMLANCVKGTLDGALIGCSVMSNIVPALGVINAPYLFKDLAQARSMIESPVGAEFMEISREKGLPVLAWGENGLRHITSNVPVRSQADLRGLKLRVPQSDVMLGGLRALGADAKPLPFSQLRDALRTGEFQAQENAVSLVEANRLNEVQKYLCLTGHVYDAIGFIASADLLEDLSEPQRQALTECARKGALVTRQVGDAAARDGIGRLKAAGMTVIEDVDVTGLRAAARPFLEQLGKTYGDARVKTLLTAGA